MGLVIFKTNIPSLPFLEIGDKLVSGEVIAATTVGVGFQQTFYFVVTGISHSIGRVELEEVKMRDARIYKSGEQEPFKGGIM